MPDEKICPVVGSFICSIKESYAQSDTYAEELVEQLEELEEQASTLPWTWSFNVCGLFTACTT